MTDITLNMIVGRWYEPFLKAAVESLLPIVDDIVIIDTDPLVNTNRENMESISGVRIIDMPRKSDLDFSFAAARQLAVDNTKTKWIIILDADDVLHEKYFDELISYTKTNCGAVEGHFWWHMLHPDYYQEIYGNAKAILFRTNSVKWERKIHEQPTINGPIISAMHIRENKYGWLKGQRDILRRYEYYYDLGSGEFPPYVDTKDPDHWLDSRMSSGLVLPYTEEHPKVVMPVLKEMFPDIGTFPFTKENNV